MYGINNTSFAMEVDEYEQRHSIEKKHRGGIFFRYFYSMIQLAEPEQIEF